MKKEEMKEMVKSLNKFFLDVGLSCKVGNKGEAEGYLKSVGKVVKKGEYWDPIMFFFLSDKEIILNSSGKKIFSANRFPLESRHKDKNGRIGRDDKTLQYTKEGVKIGINWEDGTRSTPLISELERIREYETDRYGNFGVCGYTEEVIEKCLKKTRR